MRTLDIALSCAVLCWGAAHAFQPTFLRAPGMRTLTTVSARPLPGLRAPLAGCIRCASARAWFRVQCARS